MTPTDELLFRIAFGIVFVTIVAAGFIKTPYGRFADTKWGVAIDPRIGWFLMELPASVVFLATFAMGPHRADPFPLFVLFVWVCHYANRGFLMPALMRVPKRQKSSFGLMVVVVGWVVTSLHGYLNASWVSRIHPETGWEWFRDPRFLIGITLYYVGLTANLHADHIVRNLRTKDEVARGERVYRIPTGGWFRWVTNAPYTSELLLWTGFALFTWSPAGFYILAISAANLVPRAVATHRWYVEKFPDYPKDRKVLIPFVY